MGRWGDGNQESVELASSQYPALEVGGTGIKPLSCLGNRWNWHQASNLPWEQEKLHLADKKRSARVQCNYQLTKSNNNKN